MCDSPVTSADAEPVASGLAVEMQVRRCRFCGGDGIHSEPEWPRTEAGFYLLRSTMFVAQVIAREMEKAEREAEIETISCNNSEVAPELSGKLTNNPLNWLEFGSAPTEPPGSAEVVIFPLLFFITYCGRWILNKI